MTRIAALFGAVASLLALGASAEETHYAPIENLERIDVALIRSARHSLDMAMYTLTDWAIIAALHEARARGVAVRIVLDPSVQQAYDKLADMADIVRVKKQGPLMHLKAYAVDDETLRTGSANLSPNGLKQQDNDLVVIRDAVVVAAFESRFTAIYQAAEPMRTKRPAEAGVMTAPSPEADCLIKGNVNSNNAVVIGLLIILVEVVELSVFRDWEEWINIILGIWLVASPWALGITSTAARWDFIATGALVLVLALHEIRNNLVARNEIID